VLRKNPFCLVAIANCLEATQLKDQTLALRDQIAAWLGYCERLAVLGIGNPLRGDDGVGMEVVKMLRGKVGGSVRLFECEMMPENFLGEIERFSPTHVLMIDAALLEAKLGEARLISPEEIAGTAMFTHALPLSILTRLLQEHIGAKVTLLGVQPKRTEFGEELSLELREAAKQIAETIRQAAMDL